LITLPTPVPVKLTAPVALKISLNVIVVPLSVSVPTLAVPPDCVVIAAPAALTFKFCPTKPFNCNAVGPFVSKMDVADDEPVPANC
jgi:hypothetical protein